MSLYVVEDPVIDTTTGRRCGTMRLWTPSIERARTVASEAPGRTWREVSEAEPTPAGVRERAATAVR